MIDMIDWSNPWLWFWLIVGAAFIGVMVWATPNDPRFGLPPRPLDRADVERIVDERLARRGREEDASR